MKKTTLALLVSAAALPVTAVAGPSMYGKLHVSVDTVSEYPVTSVEDALADLGDVSLPDQWQVQSNSSRIGIRGVDPLDNKDLKAIYQVEVGVDVDGDSSATFSTRNSYLGLDTPAGKFFAGKYDSVVKQAEMKQDQFNDTAADIENIFFTQRRINNSLNYVSPSMGALVFKVQLAPGEGDTDGNEIKDGIADTLGASVEFSQDTLIAALAYESSYLDSAAFGALVDTQALRGTVGVNLDGGVQMGAVVEQLELESTAPGGEDFDVLSWMVSAKLGVGERLDLKAQMGMLDSSDLDSEITVISAGADYALGKATKVYGLISVSDTEIDQPLALTPLVVDESGNLVSVGMIHSF